MTIAAEPAPSWAPQPKATTPRGSVFYNVQRLINEIVPDEPDPTVANALQEGWAASSARCG